MNNRFTQAQYKQAWTPNSYIQAAGSFLHNLVSRPPQAPPQNATMPQAPMRNPLGPTGQVAGGKASQDIVNKMFK